MANIVTNTEVFEFMGTTAADVISKNGTRITNLITREQADLEELLGRKVSTTAFTDVLFHPDLNCMIIKDQLFLGGIYRDTYSISAITEDGSTLTAAADYNDGGDYYLDAGRGILIRIDDYWSLEPLGIKISGNCGLGGATTLTNIEQVLIEMVATKSGLWKTNVETEEGTIQTIRTNLRADTKKMRNRYILRDWGL